MANTVYNIAKRNLLDDYFSSDIASGRSFRALLIQGSTGPDPDHATVTAVLAAAAELTGASGYTAGPSSSSRVTVTPTVATDNANDRATVTFSAPTWTAVNTGTVRQVLIYRHESSSDDSLNIPVACIDTATGLPLTLNGSDVNGGSHVIRLT